MQLFSGDIVCVCRCRMQMGKWATVVPTHVSHAHFHFHFQFHGPLDAAGVGRENVVTLMQLPGKSHLPTLRRRLWRISGDYSTTASAASRACNTKQTGPDRTTSDRAGPDLVKVVAGSWANLLLAVFAILVPWRTQRAGQLICAAFAKVLPRGVLFCQGLLLSKILGQDSGLPNE